MQPPRACAFSPRSRWVVAIGGEIAGIVLLCQHKFDHGNLPLLIGILVGIAIFAIAGSLMWKAANRHDPARASDTFRFFVQNQLGAIITLIAFLPLVVLIFTDKDMDPQNKKVAGGVGAVLAVVATLIGVSYNPPSVEQYTQDMNTCAAQIKAGQPTTACSPEVAAQAQEIATDSATVAAATKDADHPAGQDVVYWIAPENGAKKSETPHVFHLCAGREPAEGQDGQSRLGDGGLRTERHPHHEADRDGTEAVRVHASRGTPGQAHCRSDS